MTFALGVSLSGNGVENRNQPSAYQDHHTYSDFISETVSRGGHHNANVLITLGSAM